jgi:hypothetical protein
MNKKKFTIFYSIWWMLTYVISYLKIGFAFGIAGVMINQRGSINSDSLDTVSIIFSLATGACYVGMYVITNKWGTVVGKKWLVSIPVISGIFDALIGIPIIPSILCIIGLILGLTSDPLDSSQKKEHPGQSESTKEINFAGVTELSNDAYKIYLVERYTITKNDVLAGFTLNGSIYNSLDEALIAAHALHCPKISIPATQDIKEEIEPASKQITSGFQVQNSDSKSSIQIYAQNELEQTSQNEINYKQYQSTKSSNAKIIFASIALIVVAFLVFRYIQLSQDSDVSFSNRSPEDRCRTAKIQALKSSEPFFLALMKGERGMNVTGYQEAISATKAAGLECGIDNYTYSNLLNESEFTGSGFALKQELKTTKVQKIDNEEEKFAYIASSNSQEFSGAKINSKIKDYKYGEALEIDGGPYFFTKNRALLTYQYDEKISYENQGLNQLISKISFNCIESVFGKSKGTASIDNITCDSSISYLDKSEWKKLCYLYSFDSLDYPLNFVYLKNNAFVIASYNKKDKTHVITELGLSADINKFNFGYKDCNEAEGLKRTAFEKGYKSLGDMVSEK